LPVASRVSFGRAWTDRPQQAGAMVAAAEADLDTHLIGRRR
jgi:hypothetical protein